MALTPLPRRDPDRDIADICAARLFMAPVMTDQGSVSPAPLDFMARVIEGHPDDIPMLLKLLRNPEVSHALLVDIEIDDDILGPQSIKALSVAWAAHPDRFGDGPVFCFGAVYDHVVMLRTAQSNHARLEMIRRDPCLEAIPARHWSKPFHGHDHSPGPLGRLKRLARHAYRRG